MACMDSMPPTKPFWETTYQNPTGNTFGKPSPEMIAIADKLPTKASVLDLGCGEGRNALFLAERGFDVTAVDISEHGISKLRLLASQRNIPIRAAVADMRSFAYNQQFDLIISHGCLHLIERAAWQLVLSQMKVHTSAGGYNIVAVFTDQIAPSPDLEAFCVGLFRENELFSFYSGWEIQLQQSYTFTDEHPGGVRHTHPLNKIVASKM